MPIYMIHDTDTALGVNADRCDSRLLRFDRFADSEVKKEDRNALDRRTRFGFFVRLSGLFRK